MMNRRRPPTIPQILEDPNWGEECPVCGDPFTPKKSGLAFDSRTFRRDAFEWDRVCQAPPPTPLREWIDERDINDAFQNLPMIYVHTVSDTA